MDNIKRNPAGAPISGCDDTQGCAVVACAACLAEVPADLATTFEGPDYVQHFCGLDCMAQWQKKAQTK